MSHVKNRQNLRTDAQVPVQATSSASAIDSLETMISAEEALSS